MNQPIMIYVTYPNKDVAKKISQKIITSKLVACANILSEMHSVYEWENKVCEEVEIPVLYKSFDQHFDHIQRLVKEQHPYDTPCITSFSLNQISSEFLSWMKQVTR